MKYSYLLFAPPYVSSSAGIRYFHSLVNDLRGRGFLADIVNDIDYRVLSVPLKTFEQVSQRLDYSTAIMHVRFGKAVVVYPEVVSGNPLGSSRVVRLVANKPGYLGGDRIYDETEKVYLYSRYYKSYVSNRISGFLYKPMLDLDFWVDFNRGDRPLKLFYVGKGCFKEGYTDSSYIEVTRSSPPRSELPSLFNRASQIVVFDNSTALAQEAALCGCVPIIIPDGSQTRCDFEAFELGLNGVAWGPDDFSRAKESLLKLRLEVERASLDYSRLLESFVADTQENWPLHASKYNDAIFLAYSAASYERDQLRKLRNFLLERNPSIIFSLGDEESELPFSSNVILWGVGKGAEKSFPYINSNYNIVLATGLDEETPAWLANLDVQYVPSREILTGTGALMADAIIVASQYRTEIKETISNNQRLSSIPLFFVADYMLV